MSTLISTTEVISTMDTMNVGSNAENASNGGNTGNANGNDLDTNTTTATATSNNDTLTEAEQAIYDRQLRMWGVEAQKRMRNSSVLMIGMNGLASEICKNLVLTGIGSLTIYDPSSSTINDLSASFLLATGN